MALTLRLLGGLTTAEIARAFLVSEATVAQRIVRAKRTLAEARVPFELPDAGELPARLSSVLEVVYLVFNEGYTATAGDDWMRPELCEEALRLGRILAELSPAEPEVHGLVALMEIQASRLAARMGPSGEPVLLLDQDRMRWDRLLMGRGFAALARAERLGGALGPYALQAAIAVCHARAPTAAETDWPRIAALYDALAQIDPSPVVELNRAVAVAMAFGPAGGSRARGRPRIRGRAEGLPPAAERARRSARQARPLRGGSRRAAASGVAHEKRPRTRAAARTGRRVRLEVNPRRALRRTPPRRARGCRPRRPARAVRRARRTDAAGRRVALGGDAATPSGSSVPQWIGIAKRGVSRVAARAASSGSMWPGPSFGPHPATGSSATSSRLGRCEARHAVEQLRCPRRSRPSCGPARGSRAPRPARPRGGGGRRGGPARRSR